MSGKNFPNQLEQYWYCFLTADLAYTIILSPIHVRRFAANLKGSFHIFSGTIKPGWILSEWEINRGKLLISSQ